MKKIIQTFLIVFTILFSISTVCYADYSFVEVNENIDNIGNEIEEISAVQRNLKPIVMSAITIVMIGAIVLVTKKNKKMRYICIVSLLLILGVILIFPKINKINPRMHIVELHWGFGQYYDRKVHNENIIENENVINEDFKVIDIDNEGVTLEYIRGYYVSAEGIYFCEYNEETVQQKLKWNTNYRYQKEQDPSLAVDGGINRYVRPEK